MMVPTPKGGRHRGIRTHAPAKINLRLRILARETTGYHQLETIFCALELTDELTIEVGDGALSLSVEGAELGPPEQNLVHRAARAFFEAAQKPEDAQIQLHKRIPAGAGLGGGSSDAAATLQALNTLYEAPLEYAELLRLAERLGSDVPFFLGRSALALAWGRGERIFPLHTLPSRPVLIVKPVFDIATPEAYQHLATQRGQAKERGRATVLPSHDLTTWDAYAQISENDFEAPTYERHPILRRVHDLIATDAIIAGLAGCGSAVYALYPNPKDRDHAIQRVRNTLGNEELHLIPTATAVDLTHKFYYL